MEIWRHTYWQYLGNGGKAERGHPGRSKSIKSVASRLPIRFPVQRRPYMGNGGNADLGKNLSRIPTLFRVQRNLYWSYLGNGGNADRGRQRYRSESIKSVASRIQIEFPLTGQVKIHKGCLVQSTNTIPRSRTISEKWYWTGTSWLSSFTD